MNKRGHQIGCIVLSGIALYSRQYILIPGIIIGSFLPDLDCRSDSYIRSKFKLLGKMYDVLPENRLFGTKRYHRSILLHSVYTFIILFILSYILKDKTLGKAILGLSIGWLGHLTLDKGGCKHI